jgi:hypothetical protein
MPELSSPDAILEQRYEMIILVLQARVDFFKQYILHLPRWFSTVNTNMSKMNIKKYRIVEMFTTQCNIAVITSPSLELLTVDKFTMQYMAYCIVGATQHSQIHY